MDIALVVILCSFVISVFALIVGMSMDFEPLFLASGICVGSSLCAFFCWLIIYGLLIDGATP